MVGQLHKPPAQHAHSPSHAAPLRAQIERERAHATREVVCEGASSSWSPRPSLFDVYSTFSERHGMMMQSIARAHELPPDAGEAPRA